MKFQRQGLSSKNIDSTLILSEDVLPVRTEAEVFDIGPNWITKGLLQLDIVQPLLVPNVVVVKHSVLPAVELIGTSLRTRVDAICRKRAYILEDFTKPACVRLGGAEQIAKPVSGPPLGLHDAVNDLKRLRCVAGTRGGLNANAVGNHLFAVTFRTRSQVYFFRR